MGGFTYPECGGAFAEVEGVGCDGAVGLVMCLRGVRPIMNYGNPSTGLW